MIEDYGDYGYDSSYVCHVCGGDLDPAFPHLHLPDDPMEKIPDGATRGWKTPTGEDPWKPTVIPGVPAGGNGGPGGETPGLERFVEIAEAAWSRRKKGV